MGREAPGFGYHPQLGTGAKLHAHCLWALTPRLTPALLEEAGLRQVQSLAQSHTVPKGQSGTFTSPHPVLPTANSPLRRAKKAAQATPAHFPSPPCTPPLSFWDPQCVHDLKPTFLSAAGNSPNPEGPQLSATGTKGTRPNCGIKGMGNSTVLLSPSPQYTQRWFLQLCNSPF